MKQNIIKIEQHLFETKNHKVRIEYRVYKDAFTYNIKTVSRLTKRELEFIRANGHEQHFHF